MKTNFRKWEVEFLGCPHQPERCGSSLIVDQRRARKFLERQTEAAPLQIEADACRHVLAR